MRPWRLEDRFEAPRPPTRGRRRRGRPRRALPPAPAISPTDLGQLRLVAGARRTTVAPSRGQRAARWRGRSRARRPVTSATCPSSRPAIVPSASAAAVASSDAGSSTFSTRSALVDLLDQAGEDRARADLDERWSTPSRASASTDLLPAHGRRDLAHQPVAALVRRRAPRGRPRCSPAATRGIARSAAARGRVASRSCAGSMSAQWKGADTGSGTARLAPAALQSALARSTASVWPAITTWPGRVDVGRRHHLPLRPPRGTPPRSRGRSRPRMAAIAPTPTGTASCMYWPRRRTGHRRVRQRRARPPPPAPSTRRGCGPATKAGRDAARGQSARSAATLVARIAGWVLAVSCRSASGPSKHSRESGEAQRGVGLVEDGAALREGVGQRLAHARPSASPGRGRRRRRSRGAAVGSLRAPSARSSASIRSFTPLREELGRHADAVLDRRRRWSGRGRSRSSPSRRGAARRRTPRGRCAA